MELRHGVACFAAWIFACGGDPAEPDGPAVDVTFEADACIASMATALELVVMDSAGAVTGVFRDVDPSFPTGVRVLARDMSSSTFRVETTVLGIGEVPIAFARYEGAFPEEALDEARLIFEDSCLGHICASGTCAAGQCVDPDMAPERDPAPAAVCPQHLWVREGGIGDCGSPDDACGTMREALDATEGAGALIELHGEGTYSAESVTTDSVTLRAWPDTGVPTIDGTGSNIALTVRAADVTIDGLEIFGGAYHGISINGAVNQRTTVRRCDVHDSGFGMSTFDNHGGLMVNNDAADVVIEDSVFRDNTTEIPGRRDSGLHINSGIRVTIRRNRLSGNTIHGLFLAISSDVLVEDNVFLDNGLSGARLADADVIFRNNVVCTTRGVGIEMQGDRPVSVQANTIIDSEGGGIVARDDSEKRVERNIIAFNAGVGLTAEPDADLVDVRNLYYENGGGDAMGFELDTSANVLSDPLLVDRSRCTADLEADSPALVDEIGAR